MRIGIIDGHPDGDPARYCHALADAYSDGARKAGHEVRLLRLSELDFPILLGRADWEAPHACPDLTSAQDLVAWSEHLMIVHPLWLGAQPARLKALLEQVLRPGFAFRAGHAMTGRLTGRSARLIVTMGMPAPVYRLWFGAHGLKALKRNVLGFVGIRPIRDTLIGNIEGLSPARRQAWLAAVGALGARGR
ncbi:NAD(P)H-dependent oxidoreductase [Brevundimonas sp.]|uniref:NAD(P)H-dependent oxidoreductase n=1 Tax=Brevundimonas sp. TaxID=1871086 RepID=UPI002EDB9E5A